jgi:hypothetical protein
MKHLFTIVIAAALVAGLAVPAVATVLEVEQFNYPGSLGSSVDGLNGGTGWGANAWSDPDNDVTLGATNASLTYPAGLTLTPTGTRIEITGADSLAQATRNLGTTMNLSTNGLNWYSSALFNRSAVTGVSTGVNFLRTSDGVIRWFYGIDSNGNFKVAVDPSQGTQSATSLFTAAIDTTYLVVARIRTNTASGNDEVFLKVFGPNDVVTEPTSDIGWDLAASGNSGVILNQVRLDMTSTAGQKNQFDEFRVGTTFADVSGVPEPSAEALLAFGALVPLFKRRRTGGAGN